LVDKSVDLVIIGGLRTGRGSRVVGAVIGVASGGAGVASSGAGVASSRARDACLASKGL